MPLYKADDAERTFPLLEEIPYQRPISLNERVTLRFHDAGHILGSSMIELFVRERDKSQRIIFSGDIGQWNRPLVRDPSFFDSADYVIMESTYGDRNHEDPSDVKTLLCKIINETVEAGGNIVIPSFAIERAQELLFYISRLIREKSGNCRLNCFSAFFNHKAYFDIVENHPDD